jgi:hypothetical protein
MEGKNDMPVRLAGGVGGIVFGGLGLVLKDILDVHLPLPSGTLVFVATTASGILFGRAAYRMFRKSRNE